jgi:hypothetical protein
LIGKNFFILDGRKDEAQNISKHERRWTDGGPL